MSASLFLGATHTSSPCALPVWVHLCPCGRLLWAMYLQESDQGYPSAASGLTGLSLGQSQASCSLVQTRGAIQSQSRICSGVRPLGSGEGDCWPRETRKSLWAHVPETSQEVLLLCPTDMCNKCLNRPLNPFPQRGLHQHCGESCLGFRPSLPPVRPASQDGLPGSLTVGFWVGLANEKQWKEIGGWEIRESRLSAAFFPGIISRGGMSPPWSSTSSRQCPWADLQLHLCLLVVPAPPFCTSIPLFHPSSPSYLLC